MCEQVRKELSGRLAQALPKYLEQQIHTASMEAVVALACRQVRYTELACPAFCQKVAALPANGEAREARLNEWIDELCRKVAADEYIRDCERVARFLASNTSKTEQQEIVGQFQLEYMAFAYGGLANGKQRDAPRGLLGARLIRAFGWREAGVLFAKAQQMLDERVFSVEGFDECARQYDPKKGKRFGIFFRKVIRWRVRDVVRDLRQEGLPPVNGPGPTIDQVAGPVEKPLEPEQAAERLEALRKLLERYCQEHGDRTQAELEVAAFQLQYMAYWDPEEMLLSTQELVKSQLERLRQEFYACQERLRQLEEALDGAWGDYVKVGEQLAHDRAVSAQGGEGEVLREAVARARGRLEQARLKIAKWEACGKPWRRSQEAIGELLGLSQATVSRYSQAVEAFLQANGWGQDEV